MLRAKYSKSEVTVKEMFLELIKLIIDKENQTWRHGSDETKDVHLLKNYQELTNR